MGGHQSAPKMADAWFLRYWIRKSFLDLKEWSNFIWKKSCSIPYFDISQLKLLPFWIMRTSFTSTDLVPIIAFLKKGFGPKRGQRKVKYIQNKSVTYLSSAIFLSFASFSSAIFLSFASFSRKSLVTASSLINDCFNSSFSSLNNNVNNKGGVVQSADLVQQFFLFSTEVIFYPNVLKL